MAKTSHKIVLSFGSFDPLHEGHRDFFRQAKSLGDRLVVVVASDRQIRALKQHEPYQSEDERLEAVDAVEEVDEVLRGDEEVNDYRLLESIDFDVLAVGYDQRPDDAGVREILDSVGKSEVVVERLKPHLPDRYKSSLFKKGA